jgi:hypothetical protein
MERVARKITEARIPFVVMVLKTGTAYPFKPLVVHMIQPELRCGLAPVRLVTRLVTVCKRWWQATRPRNAAGVCCVSQASLEFTRFACFLFCFDSSLIYGNIRDPPDLQRSWYILARSTVAASAK